MRTYVSMVGKNDNIVLNSLWAVLKEELYVPERIVLLLPEDTECDELELRMRNLLKAYDIDTVFENTKFKDGLPLSGNETVLDISGGDNASIARLFIRNKTLGLKHIFLLRIEDDVDPSTPYPLMNHSKIEMIDIIEEEGG